MNWGLDLGAAEKEEHARERGQPRVEGTAEGGHGDGYEPCRGDELPRQGGSVPTSESRAFPTLLST